jgi:gluconate 2-dehydrogenase gamma chain
MPDAPAVRYRSGLKALKDYVKATFAGKAFSELASTDQDKVLAGLETGSITLKDVKGGDCSRCCCRIRRRAHGWVNCL